jgi:hypothetical protein
MSHVSHELAASQVVTDNHVRVDSFVHSFIHSFYTGSYKDDLYIQRHASVADGG